MPRSSVQIAFLLAGVAICAVAAIIFVQGRRGHHESSTPDISGLREQLTRTAEQSLPAPTLSDSTLQIVCKESEAAARAGHVVSLVEKLGGDAIQTPGNAGTVRILARIPPAQTTWFRAAALAGPGAPASTPDPGGSSVPLTLIDVVVGP